jgi:hypothetical protein
MQHTLHVVALCGVLVGISNQPQFAGCTDLWQKQSTRGGLHSPAWRCLTNQMERYPELLSAADC